MDTDGLQFTVNWLS